MLLSSEIRTETKDGKKIKTRHRLVVAAAFLFQRRGFYGVGTEEVLQLAKAPRGSLYHHFPKGKEELAEAAVEWVTNEMVSHIRQLRLSGNTPEEVVKKITEEIGQWMSSRDFEEGSLLSAIATCLDGQNENLAKKVREAYLLLSAEYEQMLLVAGIPKQLTNPMATSIISEIEGATLLTRTYRDVTPLKEAEKRLSKMITKERSHK